MVPVTRHILFMLPLWFNILGIGIETRETISFALSCQGCTCAAGFDWIYNLWLLLQNFRGSNLVFLTSRFFGCVMCRVWNICDELKWSDVGGTDSCRYSLEGVNKKEGPDVFEGTQPCSTLPHTSGKPLLALEMLVLWACMCKVHAGFVDAFHAILWEFVEGLHLLCTSRS